MREQLAAQLCEPVRFTSQIEAMYEFGARIFIEIGPGNTLSELTRRCLTTRDHLALPLDRNGQNGVTQLWLSLGQLAVAGREIDWNFGWEGFRLPAQTPAKESRLTVRIDGTNYGKPYPPSTETLMPKERPDRPLPAPSAAGD